MMTFTEPGAGPPKRRSWLTRFLRFLLADKPPAPDAVAFSEARQRLVDRSKEFRKEVDYFGRMVADMQASGVQDKKRSCKKKQRKRSAD